MSPLQRGGSEQITGDVTALSHNREVSEDPEKYLCGHRVNLHSTTPSRIRCEIDNVFQCIVVFRCVVLYLLRI